MTDAPKPTLTEAEQGTVADLARKLDPILYPHMNPLMQDWPRLMQIARQVRTVFQAAGWVSPEEAKAREAAARREALLEAAEHCTARANEAHRCDLHVVSDTWDVAAVDLRALAEPERDEEGR